MQRYLQVEITSEQKDRMNSILENVKVLHSSIDSNCKNCREKALAFTKLEECLMWTNKAISHEILQD